MLNHSSSPGNVDIIQEITDINEPLRKEREPFLGDLPFLNRRNPILQPLTT